MLRGSHIFDGAAPSEASALSPGGNPRNRDLDFIVEHDPSGDYRPGSTFARVELKYMMLIGSVEPGTLLRHRDGTRWRVAGRELVEA